MSGLATFVQTVIEGVPISPELAAIRATWGEEERDEMERFELEMARLHQLSPEQRRAAARLRARIGAGHRSARPKRAKGKQRRGRR
jgi:hypothetical protein